MSQILEIVLVAAIEAFISWLGVCWLDNHFDK